MQSPPLIKNPLLPLGELWHIGVHLFHYQTTPGFALHSSLRRIHCPNICTRHSFNPVFGDLHKVAHNFMELLESRQWENDGGPIRTCDLQNFFFFFFNSALRHFKIKTDVLHSKNFSLGGSPRISLGNDPGCCSQGQKRTSSDQL